ncbi:DUF397 domain-containing protein [Actinoplanes sp. TRM 88003]|uniref:DUF397 domain-containing protein n=1 Tax=Paractinoplanes aksuensis TaxID=2939490 RepID=A0ABT1DR90_9ACTN|nr:DUF397 domain-containing protein [Actinoplanes aksuensis]MCO8273363.1 DUF397 domain-containing protein [Actinoplanes aksuensis]
MIKLTAELEWRKTKRCTSGNCVEVALTGSHVLVRNSTSPDDVLSFTVEEWEAFVGGVKEGEFSS